MKGFMALSVIYFYTLAGFGTHKQDKVCLLYTLGGFCHL